MQVFKVRLQHVWNMVTENHKIVLKVKLPDGTGYYSDGYYDRMIDPCPYYRQFAEVLSVYAITTEVIEITISENMQKKG